MKIALIGRYGEGDIVPGPERVARELFRSLKEKNVDVTFIEYFFSGYSDYTFLNKIFGSKKNPNGTLRLGIIPLIIKLFRDDFDIIHFVNSQRFFLIILFLNSFFKTKIISTLHGLHSDEIKKIKIKRAYIDRLVEKKIIQNSDILIFPSNLLLDVFIKNYKIEKNRCRVIYNGVSQGFIFNKKDFRKEKLNFIYFNSFGKGLDKLLTSIPEELITRVRIYALGNNYLNIQQNKFVIIFEGHLNHNSLNHFLADKHFIIKTEYESFSILTAESMAAGVIPIVSANTGIKEIITNGANGFIYNDNESLSFLLKEIFDNKYNLQEISENASKIYDELNWNKISGKYLSVYKSLL